MSGFKGQWEYSVDAKGRVALPAKLRRSIRPEANSSLTVTRGFEPCLYVFPAYEWENVESQLRELNTYMKESRAFIRTILGWADDVTLDGQGRMALSKRLMDFANITEKVLIIGTLERIELWDPATFDRQESDQTIEYEQLAELVMGGGSGGRPELLE